MKWFRAKRIVALTLITALLAACGTTEPPAPDDSGSAAASAQAGGKSESYPSGKLVWWATGQPKFRKMYFDSWLERNADIAPGVEVEATTIATNNDALQKIAMYSMSGDYESMPDILFLDSVGVVNMAMNGFLLDMTDYYSPMADEFVPGAVSDATIGGKIYALPDAVRPQMLFYNAKVFERYGVDPAMMNTFDGYLEAGRQLKEKSGGKVYLSYIDPGSYTWRYWCRRGLMPQAGAKIWDDAGNVVIGEDPGTKLALGFLDQLNSEGLLYKTDMMQQPLYEATDEGIIATYYMGAFWDEFMRGNLTETAGDWRAMAAPVFPEIGTGGAPVSTFYCLIDKHDDTYVGLLQKLWYDFVTDGEAYKTWVDQMMTENGPYNNPVSLEMLKDPYWQEPSDFYGGQSFRKTESEALNNPSANLVVTPSDAEADNVISAEIETYVAGEQTMEQAIANMDRELKARIGQAQIP